MEIMKNLTIKNSKSKDHT